MLEQREEKDIYYVNGFTQRKQRGDDQEERLKTEIISDFNEFESINREAENILGVSILSPQQNSKLESMTSMAESVLRMKLSPRKNIEKANDKVRHRS